MKKHKLASDGTTVRVTAEKEKGPARLENFRIEVRVPAELDEKHQQGVEESVHHCLIHNTLLHAPKIELEISALTAVAS